MKWGFIVKNNSGVDISTLQRIFWVRWQNNFPPKDIEDIDARSIIANGHFSQYQINNKEVSSFLTKSSLNPFDLLNDQIKAENLKISEVDLI